MLDDPRPKILCVDDEKNVLDGLSRTLRSLFIVETAIGGRLGLEVLKSKGPFVVVTSDLRMPLMDGIEFLARAREVAPDTIRVLLTGQGDLDAAVSAINDGNIFRFLTKPCPTGVLVRSLMACAEQYRLLTVEKVLLEQTLRGSIKTLTEILALTNPNAFGRATRVQRSVTEIMDHFKIAETWPVEVAAMFSQIGYVALPPKTQEKIYRGACLTHAEVEMVDRIPAVVEQLLANIPRLELVREILRLYPRDYAGSGSAATTTMGQDLPWGARALKIALDCDILESESESDNHPFDILRSRIGCYDPVILETFAEIRGRSRERGARARVEPARNHDGDVFRRRRELFSRASAHRPWPGSDAQFARTRP